MMQSTDSSSLMAMKIHSEARQSLGKKEEQRKKSLMVLILHHLLEHGYFETSERLMKESNISSKHYAPADNIDLLYILQARIREFLYDQI